MVIVLRTKIYPLEAILQTCYHFVEKAYLYLDSDRSNSIVKVKITPKAKMHGKSLQLLKGDFMNELLHNALRHTISSHNKTIREYIVSRALCSALPYTGPSAEEVPEYKKDPLGIAIPWEEKYLTKKRSR